MEESKKFGAGRYLDPKTGTTCVVDAGGRTYYFPDQAALDAFRTSWPDVPDALVVGPPPPWPVRDLGVRLDMAAFKSLPELLRTETRDVDLPIGSRRDRDGKVVWYCPDEGWRARLFEILNTDGVFAGDVVVGLPPEAALAP